MSLIIGSIGDKRYGEKPITSVALSISELSNCVLLQSFAIPDIRPLNGPHIYFLPDMPWVTTTILNQPMVLGDTLAIVKIVEDFVRDSNGNPVVSEELENSVRIVEVDIDAENSIYDLAKYALFSMKYLSVGQTAANGR